MHLARIFGHLEHVRREGSIDSVRDGGDARLKLSDAIVRVEEKKFVAIARHVSTT